MDPASRLEGAGQKRSALSEIQPRGYHLPQPPRSAVESPSRIPHHDSLRPEGNLLLRDRPKASHPHIQNKRLSAIADDRSSPNKRDSQQSTTSTNSAKAKRKTHIGPWQLGKTLGKGATGRVRLAKHAVTGQMAAIKIISKKSAAMVQSASVAQMDKTLAASATADALRNMPFGIEREIVIMKLITHPNIVTLYDIWENRGELYLVLEHVEGGELFEYVSRNGALPESEAVRLFRQIVAALAYCHRYSICHRDLKPENILLDKNRNIKLADFGMAALQPKDKWLMTSCGSPHYAAPEICYGRQYRGDRVDIWSVGIILFAMLCGFLPFDGGEFKQTLALVRKGEYYLPPSLSQEASDLIQRILQKRPEDRITMAEIWRHPLLKKYEKLHASLAAPAALVGPPPSLTPADCGPCRIKRADIDRELLRNLQTLWPGEKQETLIKRLLSNEPNHEKLFYWALVKFRDEQLESFSAELLQYSSSDYQHAARPVSTTTKPAGKVPNIASRHSQFSIVSVDSRRREGYYKNPAVAASKTTQGTYDPYRASPSPNPYSSGPAATTTVQHNKVQHGSYASRTSSLRPPSVQHSQRLPSSTATLDSRDLEKLVQQKRTTFSTVSSRPSVTSSKRPGQSAIHKRNVSFQHRSQKSHSTGRGSRLGMHNGTHSIDSGSYRLVSQSTKHTLSDSKSTPNLPVVSEITRPRVPASELNMQKTRSTHSHWKEESRQVSVELGKICEEAFNRSNVSSIAETSQILPVDSPATTVSVPDALLNKSARSRPLPITPVMQELIEKRQKIIDTWGDTDPKTLADIISTLDRRIVEEHNLRLATEKRAASDPTDSKSKSRHLSSGSNPAEELFGNLPQELRSASDPVRRQDNTIRLVTPDPMSPMAKKQPRQNKAMPVNSLKGGSLDFAHEKKVQEIVDNRTLAHVGLDPIEENPSSPRKNDSPERTSTKKWGWLTRMGTSSQEDLPPTPPRKNSPLKNQLESMKCGQDPSSRPERSDEKEIKAIEEKKRSWFQKMFSRKTKKDIAHFDLASDEVIDEADDDDDSVITSEPSTDLNNRLGPRESVYAGNINATTTAMTNGRAEISQNWLARFFHLKPAMKILVLQTSKVRARKEIARILREWKKFGLQDVVVEKRAGGDVVRGRVDVANYLHIKPVSFFANFYIVLDRGRKANLSIVRFTQEKGAASSFYRVVETLESVLSENDLLLLDKAKRKLILKGLKTSGL